MKEKTNRGLATRILCWVLAFLMVGGVATTLIYALAGML